MLYVMTWKKKRHGTSAEYEAGRTKVIELVRAWRQPDCVQIHQFVLKVGEPGGYVVFEADDLSNVAWETAAFAGLNVHIEPVINLDDALAGDGRVVEWRDAVV